jgi:rod shape-determining protein MreC
MKRKSVFTFILICILLAGFVLADQALKLGLVKTAVSYTAPVGRVFTDLGSGISGDYGELTNLGKLQSENKKLQNDYNNELIKNASLNSVKQEDAILLSDLNFKKQNSYVTVEANVIFFNPNDVKDTLTIDKGTKDGLKNGDVALSQGFLIGQLQDVTSNSSKVLLSVDPASSIPAVIVGTSLDGLVQGQIGSGLNLNQIPQSNKITTGQLVATSGLGGTFPAGLIIGKVQAVQQISGSIFQSIGVRPMVDFNSLVYIMVIKS